MAWVPAESAVEELMPRLLPLSGCQPAPEGYSPTLQWQQQQVAQFSTVRQNVNKHRSHWKSQQLDSNVTMPKSEDEEGWKKFCLGEKLCADGAVGPATNESPGIDYVQIGFPPLLSIVSRMNQATVTSVLEYLSNWFGERDFTPELGRWLYALLACLEKPLLPEAHSLIRQLARRCSEVRLLVVGSHSVAQAGMEWCNHSTLQPQPPQAQVIIPPQDLT
ncbi:gem-associated protein 2 isoform X8 [Cebus imitator]|uniref:gem-associated protein 2 isoform X8 n=1 Tax=Cebus imitator TaxID=2715852 RepID=UPI00189C1801|nr:gem-associated protein 2 isoform X8 [Cebus imitator]